MTTVIDTLMIKLGLDSKDLSKGAKQVQSDLSGVEKSAKKTGQGFDEAAKSVVKFLAVVGGAAELKRFIEDTIKSSAALERLSLNLNESVENISAWSNAVEQSGGSAQGLQSTMEMLSMEQSKISLGLESHLIPLFNSLGMSLVGAKNKGLPVDELLANLATRFEGMDRMQAHNIGKMMGIDEGTLNLVLQGRKELELTLKRNKEYNAVSKEQAEAMAKVQQKLIESKQNFAAFGRELLMSALPALNKLLDLFSNFGDWAREHKDFVIGFLTVLAGALTAVGIASIPINATAAAVLALAAGIATLYDDYQTWKKGGDSFFGDDWLKAEAGIYATGHALKWMKDLLRDVIYRAVAAGDVFVKLFNRDWAGVKFAASQVYEGTGEKYGESQEQTQTSTPTPKTQASGTMSRGDRNNNFGNLNYVGQQGAELESPTGRFAKFKTADEGIAAWYKQISLYVNRDKLKTIASIIPTYAPKGDKNNESAYISGVSKNSGIGANEEIDLKNENKMVQLARAFFTQEGTGKTIGDDDIRRGYFASLRGGVPSKANAASKTTTTIGEIKVYTQATDSAGITKDIGNDLSYLFNSQSNTGML